MAFRYQPEEILFLKKNIKGTSINDLTILFNKKFGHNKSKNQIHAIVVRHGFTNDIDKRFKKGQTPVNKGKKYPGKISSTSFKKGHRPANYKAVGTVIKNSSGNNLIKVKDEGPQSQRWQQHHRYIWEQAHGKIPNDSVVIFLDRNVDNVNLDNLYLVKKRVLTVMTVKKMLTKVPDLNKIAVKNAELLLTVGDLQRKQKSERKRAKHAAKGEITP